MIEETTFALWGTLEHATCIRYHIHTTHIHPSEFMENKLEITTKLIHGD